MKSCRILSLAGAALLASVGAASAGLIIVPNGNAGGVHATTEATLNSGPGFPTNIFGYTSTAYLQATSTGDYRFTFEGAGTASNSNTFFTLNTLATTFTANGPGGLGAGSTPAGTSFTQFLTAGEMVAFTLTSSGGCSISDGSGPSPAAGCNYLIALANSASSPGAVGPQDTAWIGFSDSSSDLDFQDMVVRVDQIPEPASWMLIGVGLVAVGLIRRRKTA